MRFAAAVVALAMASAGPVAAQDFQADPEIVALFLADQSARKTGETVDAAAREADDTQRRRAMRELLDQGRLMTADEYFLAAFVFQHGRGDDCLLAHSLAVVALAMGKADAGVIAAATLDRYLQDIGRAQVYGTQFMIPFNGDPVTQAEYDDTLLTDAVRQAMGVPTRAEQAEQVQNMEQNR